VIERAQSLQENEPFQGYDDLNARDIAQRVRDADEATARRVQLALDYDPRPPFGGIDWAHIPPLPRAMRAAVGLLAPAIAAKPKRLTRAGT
jgi:hypothetical protein